MSDRSRDPSLELASAVHVAGLRVCRADVDGAVELLWRDIGSTRPRVYLLVNAHSASLRADSPDYAAALEDDRSVGLPDGYSVTFGARWMGLGDVGRAPGPDVFAAACERAAADGTRFYLLGGAENVAQELRDTLTRNYPGLRVVGVATPPFGVWPDEVSAALAAEVRTSGAQVLWLGVSAPKQEVWAIKHIEATGLPTVCVGAAFDFLTGRTGPAPVWMRRNGLEWLFRLASEPRRLWRRYLVGNLRFLIDLIRFGSRSPRKR